MLLEKVKWTFSDAYLWQTMWNHAKKSMEGSKLSDLVLSLTDRSSLLKTPKTSGTKMWITQNFELVWPIQGRTMSKSTSSAFRICVAHRGLHDLSHRYELSKSSEISREKMVGWRGVTKKQHSANFGIWCPKRKLDVANRVVFSEFEFWNPKLNIDRLLFFRNASYFW